MNSVLLYNSYNFAADIYLIVAGVIIAGILLLGWIAIIIVYKFKDYFNESKIQYAKLHNKRKNAIKLIAILILIYAVNFIPYYSLYNQKSILIFSSFNDVPQGYYIHKGYYLLPLFSFILCIILVFKFDKLIEVLHNSKIMKYYKFILTLLSVFLLSYFWYLYVSYNENILLERQKRHLVDSLYVVKFKTDSINLIARQKADSIKKEKENFLQKIAIDLCTEDNAISNFKEWLMTYYPNWKLKKIVKLKAKNNCQCDYDFKI
ncbi:MAG: hypothetical protein NTU43_00950 [Bacteroidetes bacterium]|nr:hypothetical protein [Bacteroidota bacterium]